MIEYSGFHLNILLRVVRVDEAPVGVWIIMGRRIFELTLFHGYVLYQLRDQRTLDDTPVLWLEG